ncbi:hypothetical protein BC834DRAFT_969013 [Gloeopeniophorella convolvens]|nr:hypothetical protein BC834DRAFT_969013 [Gloeopeniophorella convolvens]
MGSQVNEMGPTDAPATAKPPSEGALFHLGEDPMAGTQIHAYASRHMVVRSRCTAIRSSTRSRARTRRACTTFHPSAKLVSYTAPSDPGAPLVLAFADASTAQADVLIGADGIRSPVRAGMYAETSRPVRERSVARSAATPKQWTGTVACRSFVSMAKLAVAALQKDHTACTNNFKQVVAYPISPTLINFIAFYSVPGAEGITFEGKWVEDVSVDEVRARFARWVSDIQALFDCLETASAWAIHIIEDLPHAADGPVAIIGDAAHARDALILWRWLKRPRSALIKYSSGSPEAL